MPHCGAPKDNETLYSNEIINYSLVGSLPWHLPGTGCAQRPKNSASLSAARRRRGEEAGSEVNLQCARGVHS